MKLPTNNLFIVANHLLNDHSDVNINNQLKKLSVDEVDSLRSFCDKIITHTYDRVSEIDLSEDEQLLKELKNAHQKKWMKGL